ncbi:MAG: AarF/UbiB family protein [Acidobacteriota bacterium]
MKLPSMRPAHVKRYLEIGRLILRHTRRGPAGDGLAVVTEAPDLDGVTAPSVHDLAHDLEALGPTFIKLGQLLSTRPDLMAPDQLESLARLQDNIAPFPFAEARAIVEEELGGRLSKIFADFDEAPIAAASLGQVHRATLRDGRMVAVKVQRPGIREVVASDLEALESAAAFLDENTRFGATHRFVELVGEFRRTITRELDYRQEARNLAQLSTIVEPYASIVVPQPVAGLTGERVLTMEFIRGRNITRVGPLARLELDGDQLADDLFGAYLEQILVAGFFHADPHPGNVFLTDDNRVALLDLGMVGAIGPELRARLLRLLLALADGKSEEVAALAEAVAERNEDADPTAFRRAVSVLVLDSRGAVVENLPIGRLMLSLSSAAADNGMRMPPEMVLLGKTLLNLDGIARVLAPQFDAQAALRRHGGRLMAKGMNQRTTASSVFAALHETAEFAEKLPARAGKILDLVAENKLSLHVDAIDHERLMEGAQKIANRITLGLIMASLIVGAALLMRVDTTFRLFGYPGLAMLCFLGAVAGGVGLAGTILWTDARALRGRPSVARRPQQL